MLVTESNEKIINGAIQKLSEFLDSDAYMEMVNNIDTPSDRRKTLNQCWTLRNNLISLLLKIYAADIEENNAVFQELIGKMQEIQQEVKNAADGLKKIADRIESAVEVAKYLDQVLAIAAKLAI